MDRRSATEYREWRNAKLATTENWTTEQDDRALEIIGQPLWDAIYRDHLGMYDVDRKVSREMDQVFGIDSIILTPAGNRSNQEKVRSILSAKDYLDVCIETKKRDDDDTWALKDYCLAQTYSYAVYDPATKDFARWIVLDYAALIRGMRSRGTVKEGSNSGKGAMICYTASDIVRYAPLSIIAQSGFLTDREARSWREAKRLVLCGMHTYDGELYDQSDIDARDVEIARLKAEIAEMKKASV